MSLTETNARIFVAATGAGAGIQSALWATPGASSYLEGCIFPYSQEATARFLGFTPPKFVSREMAVDLAIAAYREVAHCGDDKKPIGLGLTASVSSLRARRGEHQVFATAISRSRVISMDAVLCKDPADRHEDGQQADAIGILLVKALAGINPSHGGAAWRDDSEFARQHFQLRPLFLRNGSRAHEPKRPLKLCPGAFNPLHAGHLASTGENVIFHITADPPHKPALSLQDMLERSLQFRGVRDVLFTEGDALYIDKARRFPNSTFYVGTDVVERILDPRWGPQPEPMLREFAELGIHFAVSPRGGVRLADLTPKIPESCRSLQLFSELPQTPHADLSSTQIRNGAT